MEDGDRLQRQIDKVMAEFDLRGDRKITPEEFFNIIMALYE